MTEHDITTDHGLAAYLAEHGALNNFTHEGKNCVWRNGNGEIVASVQYDSARCVKLSVLTFK